MVNIKLRILSKPDIPYLPHTYQTLGTDYDDRVLPSIGNEVLKSVVVSLLEKKKNDRNENGKIYVQS
jgi:hypothetical protein